MLEDALVYICDDGDLGVSISSSSGGMICVRDLTSYSMMVGDCADLTFTFVDDILLY